jgi:hypothetical protein
MTTFSYVPAHVARMTKAAQDRLGLLEQADE